VRVSPKVDFVNENLYPDYIKFSGSKIPSSAEIIFDNILSTTIKNSI